MFTSIKIIFISTKFIKIILYFQVSFASYQFGHNKYLVEYLARNKSPTCIKFWCHLLIPTPIIYQFLHQSFMPLLVPASSSESFLNTKMITDFSLLHYIEFIITSARPRFFEWQNDISWKYLVICPEAQLLSPCWGWKVSIFLNLYLI